MKKLLYVIIIICGLYIVLAFFGPSQVVVEREITINKPASFIKPKLADFKFFHDTWSPWTEKDPEMKNTYEGTSGEVGSTYSWSGNKKVGSGTMKIVAINGDSIKEDISFGGKGNALANLITKDNGNTSTVKWQMVMHIGFFGRTPMLFMNMDKMMGPDFEAGLAKLKTSLENMKEEAPIANYEIKELEWPEVTYVGTKTETVKFENLGPFFAKNFPAIGQQLGKNNIKFEAPPSGIYSKYDESKGEADVAAVVKVANGTKIKDLHNHIFPASKVLHIAYFGDYAKSANAHYAMDAYMKQKGVTQSAVIEEYANDPMVEKDTTKWQTNIYYILK